MSAGVGEPRQPNRPVRSRRVRVLIVDDHPIFRRGLRDLIAEEPDFEVCCEAADAPEALRRVGTDPPDVAIIDLSLKESHGLELIEAIKARNERIKMLVCSVHDESSFAERALRAGAMGYISKQEAADKLIEALRQIVQGEIWVSQRAARRLLHRMAGGKPPDTDPVQSLTNRELEVFEMIGEGLTTKQIARRLHLSPKTVEAHREKIKAKLNVPNSAQLSRHAFQWVHEHR